MLHLNCFCKPYILTKSVCVVNEMCRCAYPGTGDRVPRGAAWAAGHCLGSAMGALLIYVSCAVVSGCESGPSGILPVGPFFPPQSGRCQGCVLKNGMGLVPEVWPFSALDFMAYVWDPFGWLVQRKQCIVSMPLTSSVTLDTLCT